MTTRAPRTNLLQSPAGEQLLSLGRSIGASQLDQLEAQLRNGTFVRKQSGLPDDEAIVTWCEREIGVKLRSVPKVLDILLTALAAFRQRKMLRLGVLGPRGGGKTYLAAVIELVAYRFFGFDWNNLGASYEQAQRCYEHIHDAHASSSDLFEFTLYCQSTETRSKQGGKIGIHTASQTSIRGAHPVGPSGGGGITLDEAALIPDKLHKASKGQMTSANPSVILQTSTMGEEQIGEFWDLIQEPAKKGYQLKSYDIFDVAKRCPYECATTCPMKEHFAEDYYEGVGPTRQMKHAAYCGGKAHDVDGWVEIDEIAQQFRELGRGDFERELMGMAVATTGHVYDPKLIDSGRLDSKALSKDPDEHRARFLKLDKAVGLDWGFSGQCALSYVVRLQDALVEYRREFFTRERFQSIREHLLKTAFDEHIEVIYADSANPSDNEELFHMGGEHSERNNLDWSPKVLPVVFSKWKAYGIGEVRRRLEKRLLFFAPDFGGVKDPNFDRAMRYLKNYHYDESGKPVKVDDHYPDALLCSVVGFAPSFIGSLTPTAIRNPKT